MKNKTPLSVKALEEKRRELWKDSGKTILHAEISFLNIQCARDCSGHNHTGIKRINSYYQHMSRQIIRYCKKKLLPQVIKACKAAAEKNEPYPETKVFAKSRLTYNENGLISIFTDITENTGYAETTMRFGDVWNLISGVPVPLSAFFPEVRNYKKRIRDQVIREVTRLRDRELGIYYGKVRKNCSRFFSSDNFYLTDEGLVIFYQMYTIAPKTEGIPSFTLKWNDKGPCKPLLY